jgi:hypothetical protein|tara:strand:+ start:125 stop:406 length:282 start_codon:yes stop_codon:yes gene_type:complete
MGSTTQQQPPSQSPSYTAVVSSVNYVGGIIGLFIDDRKKLESAIQEKNDQGYRLRTVLPAKNSVFSLLIQLICLALTCLLWTPIRGETLIFEG